MRRMRRVPSVPGVFIQPAHVTAKAVGGRRSSACRVFPFRLGGHAVTCHAFLGIEPPQELLHVLPGDLLAGEDVNFAHCVCLREACMHPMCSLCPIAALKCRRMPWLL